ncbi:MAG: hypothetical protein GC191_06875 [Azospirillum sp.]|nr:hypothetical protein [Azospirillum sp.]
MTEAFSTVEPPSRRPGAPAVGLLGSGIGPAVARSSAAREMWSRRVLAAGLFLVGPVGALAPLGMAPLFIATAVVVVALRWLGGDRLATDLEPVVGLCLLFGVYAGLSLIWTPAPAHAGLTMAALVSIFLPGFVLLGMVAALPAAARPPLENAFLAGLGTGLLLLLVEIVTDAPISAMLDRAFGAAAGPLAAGGKPATIFALMIWPAAMMLYRRGRIVAAHLLPSVFGALSLLGAASTSLLAMAAGLGVMAIAWQSTAVARRVLGSVLIVCFVAAVPIARGLDAFDLGSAEWLSSASRDRVELWTAAADRVLDQPLFGFGLDAARGPDISGETPGLGSLQPRDVFLQIWVELGVVGAGLSLAIALAALAALHTLPDQIQRFALAGYASTWVILGTAYGAWQEWWLCTILTAAAALVLAGRWSSQGTSPAAQPPFRTLP